MFEGLFQPMHLLVIFGIALLVFGPKKLPELGKGIGEGIRGFKSAMKRRREAGHHHNHRCQRPRLNQEVNHGFGNRNPVHTYARILVLGPKQLHTLLGHVARAKAQFEEASRGFKSQLGAELDAAHQDRERQRPRMKRWGKSELSSDPRYRNSEPTG